MTRFLLAATAMLISSPALAQHEGHGAPPVAAPAPAPAPKPVDPHAGHDMSADAPEPAPAPAAPVAAPVKKNAPAAKKPRPADTRRAAPSLRVARNAPFVLTGVEKRGAESWAAIAPRGYSSLSQVALVGEGETVAGWTLVSAGYGEATFRVNGRLTVLRAE